VGRPSAVLRLRPDRLARMRRSRLRRWPTVAGRETSGSLGFPFLAGDVAVGVDHARGHGHQREGGEDRFGGELGGRGGQALKTVNPSRYSSRSSLASLEVRSRACVTLPP
jgi:hypothetical protein